jgi:Zn-dependent M28 family amino/carboxypeptidase
LSSVSPDEIRLHLLAIEGIRNPNANPQNIAKAQVYIETTLSNLGYEVTQHSFDYANETYQNVIATRPGTRYPDERVLVIAHYDTVTNSPGADDNASGVAVMLELARLLQPYTFERTIQFVATNLEEQGSVGSLALAQFAQESGWHIKGVIDLEMVGYAGNTLKQSAPLGLENTFPKVGDFICVIGNETSKSLVEQFISGIQQQQIPLPHTPLVVPGNGESLPDTRRSDHSPFWDAGYPAIALTDTAEFRNPHYHQPSDTNDTINLNFAANVCRAVGELVNTLAVSID